MMSRKPIDIEWLRFKASNTKLVDISEETGWSIAYISLLAKKNGIKFQKSSKLLSKSGEWDNAEWLRSKHWDQELSIKSISKLVNLAMPNLLKRFKQYNIPIRDNTSAIRLFTKKKEWRDKMAIIYANTPKVSSIQKQLYSILDDLNIKYYKDGEKETIIGPYVFDCAVPVYDKILLIECQGDYWHNLNKSIRRDKAKYSYIESMPGYEIRAIWEHEFKCKDKIIELIKYWCGISALSIIDFDFNDVVIKKVGPKDTRVFLDKFHYLGGSKCSGNLYGAYIDDILVATSVFAMPVRQNIHNNIGCEQKELVELTRFCIHPSYQKKNFGSWFLSRCMKLLFKDRPLIRKIISYSDKTFNHNGALYKACNFELHGVVKEDYFYVDKDGWKMHKKTLYNHAISLRLTEKEFADKYGYKKIFGNEKLRFVFTHQK